MALQNLEQALIEEMMDLLSAEKQLTKALPKMAKNVSNEELKGALQEHLEITKEQVKRLEEAFSHFDRKPRSKTCEAMKGLIEEGEGIMEKEAEDAVKDAMIIAAAQKVENYEIASYGTVCAWADTLGLKEVGALLKETLSEEKEADKLLTKISKQINKEAKNGANGSRK